jgi:hypothetical protein
MINGMESIKFPLEEAMKIQEALNPLGYMVHGFKDEWGSGNGLITIELRAGGTFPYRKSFDGKLTMDGVPDSVTL